MIVMNARTVRLQNRSSSSHEQPRSHHIVELLHELLGEARALDQHARLNVARVALVGEFR